MQKVPATRQKKTIDPLLYLNSSRVDAPPRITTPYKSGVFFPVNIIVYMLRIASPRFPDLFPREVESQSAPAKKDGGVERVH